MCGKHWSQAGGLSSQEPTGLEERTDSHKLTSVLYRDAMALIPTTSHMYIIYTCTHSIHPHITCMYHTHTSMTFKCAYTCGAHANIHTTYMHTSHTYTSDTHACTTHTYTHTHHPHTHIHSTHTHTRHTCTILQQNKF